MIFCIGEWNVCTFELGKNHTLSQSSPPFLSEAVPTSATKNLFEVYSFSIQQALFRSITSFFCDS